MIRYRCKIVAFLLLLALPAATGLARESSPGGRAFLKSLLVPGWGQYDLGRKNAALTFVGTELLLVGGMLTMNAYGASTRDDYEALATLYAGVIGDHGHDFYVDVGNWMSVDEYNERRLQGREYDALYTAPEDRWRWDTDEHRAEMEKLRIKSDRAINGVMFLVGGVVLNHLTSAVHAGRLAARQKQGASALSLQGWSMDVRPVQRFKGFRVDFSHAF